MINERNSTQANPSTSTNMSYGYPTNRFDLMNMSPMQNPNDLYSYYPTNIYQPFNRFDDHNQWGSADTSNGIPPLGPLPYHPQIYSPTGLDLSHNTFDYPPPPAPPTYPSYHPGFTPTTNTSTFDMSWNLPNLPVQQQQQIPLIGNTTNKKSTIYDDYSTTNSNISDMLVQQMNSVNLGNNDTQNFNILSSKEQQQYLTNSNNLSFTRPAQISSGPKSYASVVSSDSINSSSNRIISSNSNLSIRSANEKNSNTQNQTYPSWLNKSDRLTNSTSSTATTNQENLDHQYNPKDFNLNSKGARFFVIKSYSEDDIHRSIKYGIWCSTEHGNKRLDTAYREREGKGPIYLFFSVNASGHFCGIAQMMSPIDYEHQTDVWHMSNKWQGKFEVKWIYVKDVPNQQFRNIRLENNENKPVTNSRDTQEIPYEKGKLMLKTFHMYRHKTSIFDDFQYYESKQAEETTTKKSSNRDFNNNNNNKSLPSNRLAKTDQEDIQN